MTKGNDYIGITICTLDGVNICIWARLFQYNYKRTSVYRTVVKLKGEDNVVRAFDYLVNTMNRIRNIFEAHLERTLKKNLES